ncbi:2OG-Fe(II) oxygenase [Phanerochaete sordida]|uniref:2OG-Fe(II) oxygenase n=1 Tax=Phanerochaete sordida TaxID=48140 RepID=A0A9P3GLS7_9APHY|nr:2OG-Fe(II) oxygenase [Phanerochaete sordida]
MSSPTSDTFLAADSDPFVPEHPHLQALNDAISSKALPCSSGVFAVQREDLVLYYGTQEPNSKGLGRIDFSSHADDEIKHLAESCDIATFGRGLEDVHDESYRKAGKLDKGLFSSVFCPELSGLMHAIRHNILEGHTGKALQVELYKLNVYGPGSFFKAHKDTPRADNMIASLVIVLPTRHAGGALVLRHEGREFKFDSGKVLSEAQTPSIAYAAFYGDVEHEVEPVVSGYRVTLTYNLYLIDSVTTTVQDATAYELALKDAFRALLDDAQYLPNGGRVGFGLRHEYPIDLFPEEDPDDYYHEIYDSDNWVVDKLLGALKGSDAILKKTCNDLGLKASLRILYCDSQGDSVVIASHVTRPDFVYEEQMFTDVVASSGHGVFIKKDEHSEFQHEEVVNVHWATRMRPLDIKKMCTPNVTYGNEPMLYKVYSTMCLIVEVGSPDARFTAH